MRLISFTMLTLAAALLLASPNARAQESGLTIEIVSVADGEFPNARAAVNIEDTSSSASPQLAGGNFTATIDGQPVAVVAAELATSQSTPLDLLLVIDTSGSMEGAPIASAKEAAKTLIAGLGESDRVAIVGFGDVVTIVQDFTSDRAAASAAIDGLIAQGNTALYQATAVAAIKIATSASTRRAVILLSDGADFGGKSIATREEALNAATVAGVPIFTVAQGYDLDRAYLQQLAATTRGRYLEAPNPEDLNALYVSLGRLLRSQYIVTFDVAAVARAAEVKVAITVTDGGRSATAERAYSPGANFAPGVSLSGVTAGETLTDTREVLVSISGGAAITAAQWFVDGEQVAETTETPFLFAYDPKEYGSGEHTLRAVVQAGGASLENSVSFSSSLPPGAPASRMPIILLALMALAAIGGAGAYVMMRVRKMESVGVQAISADQRTAPMRHQVRRSIAYDPPVDGEADVQPESIGEALGVLISRSGPDIGTEYRVGGRPVGIGSGKQCGVRVADPEMALEEARIWVRGGHLMLHKITKLASVHNDGTAGGWVFLDPGDTFQISEHSFEFQLLPEGERAAQQEQAAPDGTPGEPGVPDVLKDRDAPPPQRPQLDMGPRA